MVRCYGYKIRFSHFLFSDINSAYPFLQLSDLKNGVFDKVCKSEDVMKYVSFRVRRTGKK